MSNTAKVVGTTLLLSAGAALAAYFTVTPFRQTVDQMTERFRADMSQREGELIEALSSVIQKSNRLVTPGTSGRTTARVSKLDADATVTLLQMMTWTFNYIHRQ